MSHPNDRSGFMRDPSTDLIYRECEGCKRPGAWFPMTTDFSVCVHCKPGAVKTTPWPAGAGRITKQWMPAGSGEQHRADVAFYGSRTNHGEGRYNQYGVMWDPAVPGQKEERLELLATTVREALAREIAGVAWVFLNILPTVQGERF